LHLRRLGLLESASTEPFPVLDLRGVKYIGVY